MTIKRRRAVLTMAAATGTKEIGLGAAYGKIFKVEIKGDDANVDNNGTFAIADAEGREIMAAKALDPGTDDATALHTSQDYSTFGVGFYLAPNEVDVMDSSGDVSVDTEGVVPGVVAKSPVTVSVASGTSGDAFEITLFVEV